MKFFTISSLLFLFPVILSAQKDSTFIKGNERNKIELRDTINGNLLAAPKIPPRTLIIKMKDLKKIKNLKENPFIVVDDTSSFSTEELSAGLSEEELVQYKKNKKFIMELLKLPPSEEATYPLLAKIRKILSVSQTVGAIIIMLLSVL
jgi:hypothetical protein